MKVVVYLVTALNIALVSTYSISPYPVYQVTNDSLWGPEKRIFGGSEAKDDQFPFMIFIGIIKRNGYMKCSASLVDPYWVLTAAHCLSGVFQPEEVILVGGKANLKNYLIERLKTPSYESVDEKSLGVQERRAEAVYIHPEYDRNTCFHDVALIRLKKPFDLPNINPAVISKKKMEKPMQCTILGWGLTEFNVDKYLLSFVHDVKVKTTEIGCKYKDKGPFICLDSNNAGICAGDSGGPLVCGGKIWAVASFYLYEGIDFCGNALEDFYSEVYPSLEWIDKQMKAGGDPSAIVTHRNLFLLTGFWLLLKNYCHVYKI